MHGSFYEGCSVGEPSTLALSRLRREGIPALLPTPMATQAGAEMATSKQTRAQMATNVLPVLNRSVNLASAYICFCRVKGKRFNHDLRAKRLLIAQRSIGDLHRMSSSVVPRLVAMIALDQSSQVRLNLPLVSSPAPFIGVASCPIQCRFSVLTKSFQEQF